MIIDLTLITGFALILIHVWEAKLHKHIIRSGGEYPHHRDHNKRWHIDFVVLWVLIYALIYFFTGDAWGLVLGGLGRLCIFPIVLNVMLENPIHHLGSRGIDKILNFCSSLNNNW